MKITFRTLHLLGIAGIGATFLLHQSSQNWQYFLQLTVFSGGVLMCLDIFGNAVWLIQVRGVTIFFKFGLLFLLISFSDFQAPIFSLIIILSSVISHAPSNVRYFSLLHFRKINAL